MNMDSSASDTNIEYKVTVRDTSRIIAVKLMNL